MEPTQEQIEEVARALWREYTNRPSWWDNKIACDDPTKDGFRRYAKAAIQAWERIRHD